ncbi:unnamed protein product, partial [Mesorhabditis belari]|uniref:Mitochondrial import receptor subunit TOM22 homolog n=1 Tax=Mesorhabditis belari TaxID=2138241 RepID=A0AAF3EVZ6_9BILA
MSAIDWEHVPDEELEETLWERFEGLSEMFPSFLQKFVTGTVDWTKWSASTGFWLTRNAVWIAATSSLILFMPYIIEKERSDLEKTQVAQQRQLLLGPAAAVQAAKSPQQH